MNWKSEKVNELAKNQVNDMNAVYLHDTIYLLCLRSGGKRSKRRKTIIRSTKSLESTRVIVSGTVCNLSQLWQSTSCQSMFADSESVRCTYVYNSRALKNSVCRHR